MPGIARLADIEAIEARGLPAERPASTYDVLRRTALAQPDAPALSYFLRPETDAGTRTWTYRQLLGQVNRTANLFHRLGVGKDSVIAYALPNLPETQFVLWGGQAAGIVAAINPLLQPEAIADLLQAIHAHVLVTLAPGPGAELWQPLRPALARVSSLRHVLLVRPDESVAAGGAGFTQTLLGRELGHTAGMQDRQPPGRFRVDDFAAAASSLPNDRLLSGRQFDPDDYSSFFCTGGTTGEPKIAMRRHRNEVANAWSVAQVLGDSFGAGKNIFCGLPLFHVNGALVTGLLPFSVGAHVVLGTPLGYRDKAVIENFWSIVDRHQIHFFSAVPTVYSALLQVPRGAHRLDSLEYGICGAAPMPRELLDRFQSETNLKILEGYGLTEATCVSSLNPPAGERRSGSIGLRLPGQAMKVVIVDDDGTYQRDALDGEVGVLVVCGPNVFAGYLREQHNHGIWLDLGDGRRWLHTGDLARRDADGYFWLTGRTKELIIRGGHNIDPAVIEQPLYTHPAVQLAAAVGRPDARLGELPVAYVQLKLHHHADETELMAYLSARIAERAAMPKSIMIIEEMPLTAVGKIFKPELKRRQAELALKQALGLAGVSVVSLEVGTDPGTQSLSANVTLGHVGAEAAAKEVLGRFPFSYRLK